MKAREVNEEVLYADDPIVSIGRHDVAVLKEKAWQTRRKRIRLCTHRDLDDAVHEMLIVHTKETYVRPHKHISKCESFHVIEGLVDLVIFDEDGSITGIIPLGDYSSGHMFYYRLSEPFFHTFMIRSDVLVFHETTMGPFMPEETVFAPWAPDGSDEKAAREYLSALAEAGKRFSKRGWAVHSR